MFHQHIKLRTHLIFSLEALEKVSTARLRCQEDYIYLNDVL